MRRGGDPQRAGAPQGVPLTKLRPVLSQGRDVPADLARSLEASAGSLVLVHAPAGYGKTTALAMTHHPGWHWYNLDGTVYTEPGIQIYEDPDPLGSPGVLSLVGLDQVKQALTGNGNDPYPLPAFYLGTCGLVFGGGAPGDPTRVDGTPLSNSAGQIVVKTACN